MNAFDVMFFVSENQSQTIIVSALVSLMLMLLCVYGMSLHITGPLDWMDRIGNRILSGAGDIAVSETDRDEKATKENLRVYRNMASSSTGASGSNLFSSSGKSWNRAASLGHKPWSYRWSPRTELTDLVDEFQTMVLNFSGKGTAELSKQNVLEIKNPFTLFQNFRRLYDQRKEMEVGYLVANETTDTEEKIHTRQNSNVDSQKEHKAVASSHLIAPRPESFHDEGRLHWGPNSHRRDQDDAQRATLHESINEIKETQKNTAVVPRLFLWICACVALPLLTCLIAISTFVLIASWERLPTLVTDLEDTYLALERSFLLVTVRLRAVFASEALSISTRDLSVLTRMAGWILFGGLQLSNNTFTAVSTGAELCKDYGFGTVCPAIQNTSITACDCKWKDPIIKQCRNDLQDSRRIQQVFFEGMRTDADPNTGARNSTSFPAVQRFPNDTSFWPSNMDALPGANNSGSDSGVLDFDTTYGRLHAISALSMIQIPLYNYVEGTDLQRTWGTFTMFEADGMQTGYVGCSFEHAHLSHWRRNLFGPSEICDRNMYG